MSNKLKGGKSAAAETANQYDTALSAGKDQVEKVVKAGSDAAEKMMTISRERMEAVVKNYDEFNSFNKQTVEAFVAAGNVTAKAMEAINAELLAYSKTQVDDAINAAKAAMSVKTLQELVDLQSNYARASFEAAMAQSTRVGEMTARLTQEAVGPINAQFQAAVEKFMKPMAA